MLRAMLMGGQAEMGWVLERREATKVAMEPEEEVRADTDIEASGNARS
jgi:hypothetical protein